MTIVSGLQNPNLSPNIPFQIHIILLMSIFLELPVPVVKGTNLSGLEPPGNAVKVEGVIAHSPSHRAFFTGGAGLHNS